jgi:predicted DNA-binding transcriptional regulator AlpA
MRSADRMASARIKGKGAGKAAVSSAAPPDRPLANEVQYLNVKQVARRFGVGVATIWRWSTDSSGFPRPVRLGAGTTRWSLDELVAFEAKLRERR